MIALLADVILDDEHRASVSNPTVAVAMAVAAFVVVVGWYVSLRLRATAK